MNKIFVVTESFEDGMMYESFSYERIIGIFDTLKKAKEAIEKHVVEKWHSMHSITYNNEKFKWDTEFCYNWIDEENGEEYNFFIEEQETNTIWR